MPQPILILLDYIERIISDLDNGLKRGSLRKTKVAYEKLTELSNYLKELLPESFIKENFEDFDRHMHFIGIFLRKKDFEWIRNNFDDLRKEDFPTIRKKIYDLPKEERTHEKRIAQSSSKVFIVHGSDHKPLKELKAMLAEFGLNPIVLHEKASGSRTIVEKLEKYSNVGYAFVILTPDDVGCLDVRVSKSLKSVVETLQNLVEAYTVIKRKGPLKKARGELSRVISLFKPRARQNVVLEFGYFMGLLGRDRVCCLYKGDVESPSDMHGIVYIPFKESVNECCDKIVKELKAAGYEIKIPSKPKEFENRYWVDLGFWVEGEPERKEAKKLYRELTTGIEYLSNDVTEVGSLTFKTYDIEEAKEVMRGARRMVDEYKGSVLESEMDLDVIKDQFSITKQPQCPKCGKLGKFSDFHCSDCGTELEPKEYIDV